MGAVITHSDLSGEKHLAGESEAGTRWLCVSPRHLCQPRALLGMRRRGLVLEHSSPHPLLQCTLPFALGGAGGGGASLRVSRQADGRRVLSAFHYTGVRDLDTVPRLKAKAVRPLKGGRGQQWLCTGGAITAPIYHPSPVHCWGHHRAGRGCLFKWSTEDQECQGLFHFPV